MTTEHKTDNIDLPERRILQAMYKKHVNSYDILLRRLTQRIRALTVKQDINTTIKGRIKSFDSYFNKYLKLHSSTNGSDVTMTDIIGIRIICPFLEDLEIVQSLLMENFQVTEVESKSEQHSFREFAYDSIHMLASLSTSDLSQTIPHTEPVFEIQLRTKLQDAWAEVEHELIYKANVSILNEPLKRKLASLNANLTLSDIIFQEIRDYQKNIQKLDQRRRESLLETAQNGHEISLLESLPAEEIDASPLTFSPDTVAPKNRLDRLIVEALDAHSNKQFEHAISKYSEIISLKPKSKICSIIYNHRGMAFFALQKVDDSIHDFTKAIEKDSSNYRAFNNRGLAYRVLKQADKALADFDKSVELNNLQVEAYYSSALVHYDLQNYSTAMDLCSKALNIRPEFAPAQQFIKVISTKTFS